MIELMTRIDHNNEKLLMCKLSNGGQTNLYGWFDKICNDYYEEQAIKERTSLDEIHKRFYDDLHESFFVTILTLLFKFLIERGVGHVVEA